MGRSHALLMPQIKQAAQMYVGGLSRREIAAEFGVSEQAVKNGLVVAGVPLRDRQHAQTVRVIRRAAVKPPHYEIGAWAWLNPASASSWRLTHPTTGRP